jgi:hypothetical protein
MLIKLALVPEAESISNTDSGSRLRPRHRRHDPKTNNRTDNSNASDSNLADDESDSDAHNISHQRHTQLNNSQSGDGNC